MRNPIPQIMRGVLKVNAVYHNKLINNCRSYKAFAHATEDQLNLIAYLVGRNGYEIVHVKNKTVRTSPSRGGSLKGSRCDCQSVNVKIKIPEVI